VWVRSVRYCVTSKLLINGRNTAIGFRTVRFTAASAILLLPPRTRLDDVDPRVAFVLLLNLTEPHQYLGS